MNFDTIKRNYDRHLWTKQMVSTAVRKGVITKEQYADITGEAYAALRNGGSWASSSLWPDWWRRWSGP